jgi:ubiquinone/menaquinone biosynthesis C-methylase UbiE
MSYFSVKSNKQIVELLKYYPQWVINIFSKTLYSYFTTGEIEIILKEIEEKHKEDNDDELNDKKIYDKFREKINDKKGELKDKKEKINDKKGKGELKDKKEKGKDNLLNRGKSRTRDVMSFFNSKMIKKHDKYLDLGGGDGTVSWCIGEYLGLKKESIICADINTWYYEPERSQDITYVLLNEDEGLNGVFTNDNEFSLITCFQSLHHMKNLNECLESCKRINGGVIIIREHDCINEYMRMLIDIEHCIFELVLKEYDQKFVDSYFAEYKSKAEWNNIFKKLGYKYVQSDYPQRFGKSNPTRYYYAMYEKK